MPCAILVCSNVMQHMLPVNMVAQEVDPARQHSASELSTGIQPYLAVHFTQSLPRRKCVSETRMERSEA